MKNLARHQLSSASRKVMVELDAIDPGQHLKIDLSKDHHYQHTVDMLEKHGMNEQRYPQLHKVLKNSRNYYFKKGVPTLQIHNRALNDAGFTNANDIATFYLSGEKACSAMGYSTVIGGTITSTLILEIQDVQTGEVLASHCENDFNNGRLVEIITDSNFDGRAVKAVLQSVLVIPNPDNNGDPIVVSDTVRSPLLVGTASIPVVEQPASKPEHASMPNIMIALSRGAGSADDCDYWFNKDKYDDNTIIMPFKGSVSFDSEIQNLALGQTLYLYFKVVRAEGGEKKVEPANYADVAKWFSRTTDPQYPNLGQCKLVWNLPADGDGVTQGSPIYFAPSPWNADTVTLFYGTIGVKTKNSGDTYEWVCVISTQGQAIADSPGFKYIKPLVFYWHCLAKGTLITLADGTSKPIEQLVGGEMVRINNQGDTLPVRATTLAKFNGKALKIQTDQGQEIVLSSCHVIMTPNGPKGANELSVGDAIYSLPGTSKIIAISEVDYDDDLINLLLGTYEQLKTLDPYGTTMFANGILVGDHQIQTTYLNYIRHNPENVLTHLHPDWHQDYRSHLEDL